MNIQESLLNHLYSLITTNTTINNLINYRLYLSWAEPDAEFPYLVHRIDMGREGDYSPVSRCTYYLDIWDYSSTAKRTLDIFDVLLSILNNHTFTTSETSRCVIWIQTSAFIPEETQNIWHYATQWNMRWVYDNDIGILLPR